MADDLKNLVCSIGHLGGPPRGLGEQGNKAIYFRGTRKQKSVTEGNKCTKAILGNREHRKSRFWFWETRKMPFFFSREQGNMYPPTHPLIKGHGHLLVFVLAASDASNNLETWYAVLLAQALSILFKWWPLNDLDLLYGKVKFTLICIGKVPKK